MNEITKTRLLTVGRILWGAIGFIIQAGCLIGALLAASAGNTAQTVFLCFMVWALTYEKPESVKRPNKAYHITFIDSKPMSQEELRQRDEAVADWVMKREGEMN
jgi:hypothetical protein